MTRLAILGANGQVGAELCLLLARRPELNLVPVCRNRSGSAFLRWHGIACRHGGIADETEAVRLLADCDVVVNSSLATGTPAQIRRIEDRIVRNMIAHSKSGAIIIHFSTQSVYGDPVEGRSVRRRNPYGRAKLATETSVRRARKASGKPAFILRLGHVCGGLQEISNTIRCQIQSQSVVLPARDCSSNTVYTAAIVGAILQIIKGGVEPGCYDLMNTPRWTWREVYAYEAETLGARFEPSIVQVPLAHPGAVRRAAGRLAGAAAARQSLRESFSKLFAHVPDSFNARALAWWYQRRARTEIGALQNPRVPAEHLSWIENGTRFFPADTCTLQLLRSMPPLAQSPDPANSWPPDLADAEISSSQTAASSSRSLRAPDS